MWLALELSTLAGSVALFRPDGTTVAEHSLPPALRRTGALLPQIAALYRTLGRTPRQTAGVAISVGPGSFTGLRTACTIARMLRSAVGCSVVGIPSFEVLAVAWGRARPNAGEGPIAALRDARRGQVYAATLRMSDGAWHSSEVRCVAAADWLLANDGLAAVISDDPLEKQATGWGSAGERFVRVAPSATDLARAAGARIARREFLAPNEIVPKYVRPPECEEVYEAKRAAAIAKRGP
ncbi:MAG: tRNA (adenosine(37)-N6)-threonylcarbamoyltransferase complex dimerization subunit type 1 TsaB [Phycisphaerae bacterium]|nr:tRNA (adenosine(37)-N6)-threonylcarbamoyltransferase complex dimerization subunit type 1 TsaB [Phycisphaerae bacterium]